MLQRRPTCQLRKSKINYSFGPPIISQNPWTLSNIALYCNNLRVLYCIVFKYLYNIPSKYIELNLWYSTVVGLEASLQ